MHLLVPFNNRTCNHCFERNSKKAKLINVKEFIGASGLASWVFQSHFPPTEVLRDETSQKIKKTSLTFSD